VRSEEEKREELIADFTMISSLKYVSDFSFHTIAVDHKGIKW